MSEETNKRIGDYQILNELGSGGMGRVYRVRNVISDRIEAMKVLLPDLAGRQELAARFLREIKLMASLNHPNIAALRTAFTADNQLIMIMEYVEGTTLAALVEKGPIPAADAVNYIDQALDALSYAHQQHVIHRDIKPANMMLTPEGVIKLMDFGIARAGDEHTLTMTGTTLGSLGYMSPEQVKGEATDARSDLYSVGVSLYEMVTGQRPFRAESDYSIMAAHVKEMPKPPIELQPGLPTALNDLIFMAIAKDPAKRFQTAAAFRNALSSVAKALPPPPVVVSSSAPTIDSVVSLSPAVTPTAPVMAAASQVSTPIKTQPEAGVAAPTNMPSLPIPPPVQPGSHRGLYMTLGALIVVAVLVAAGIYVPRYSRTHATVSQLSPVESPSATPAAQSQSDQAPSALPQSAPESPSAMPQSSPAGVVPAAGITNSAPGSPAPSNSTPNSSPSNSTANSTPATSAPTKASDAHPQKHVAKRNGSEPAQDANAAGNPPETANNSAALDEMEHQLDQLSNRAAAVDSSLERLQQQQSAAGYGLRGDMAARQASMKNNLAKAQDAAERGDLQRAKRYADQTQSDVEALERFLGH